MRWLGGEVSEGRREEGEEERQTEEREKQQWRARERGCMRAMETRSMKCGHHLRPPDRLRSNIFYFLMKREEIKRKTHPLKKKHRCGGGGRGGGNAGLASATFTCTFLNCFILPERARLCTHKPNALSTQACSRYCPSLSGWMVVIVKCRSGGRARALPLWLCAPPPRDSGTSELTFLSNAHSCDMISGRERARTERGRLNFLFPANRLYIMSPEPDELPPLHKWVQLICHYYFSLEAWSATEYILPDRRFNARKPVIWSECLTFLKWNLD